MEFQLGKNGWANQFFRKYLLNVANTVSPGSVVKRVLELRAQKIKKEVE